jgi:NADPH:quinone reductase-like Zn-dependent oxidoreductase
MKAIGYKMPLPMSDSQSLLDIEVSTLNFAHAAAMPLTKITAWELLFDRLEVGPSKPVNKNDLLIIVGAGGVVSILSQLARVTFDSGCG